MLIKIVNYITTLGYLESRVRLPPDLDDRKRKRK